ncbi:MAG: AtpZ/AtpI family protein [Roseburia sp.]|nr:AtpZ/AtpI family protein [Ruminococcus sp.]MCM1156645.1 AtpZ/AtpI family protein [Roseburia sp.]MCM1242476.1 AtpZ/AtpI family protein [Roseburia sp.]
MKFNRNVYHSLMMISQFGINMLVPIFLCSFLGIFIDKKCGTSFWVVVLFFIGAVSGFTNVFRFARKIYEEPAVTRQHLKKDREEDKHGKKREDKN